MAEDEDYELEVQSIGRLLSRTDLVKIIDDDNQDMNSHDYNSIKDNTKELDLLPLYSIATLRNGQYDKSSMNITQAVLDYIYDIIPNEWEDGKTVFDSFKTKSEKLLDKIKSKPLHDLYVEPVGEILKLTLPLLLIVLLSKQINDTYIIKDTIEEYAEKEDYRTKIKQVGSKYDSSFQKALIEDKAKVIRMVNALIRGGAEEDIA